MFDFELQKSSDELVKVIFGVKERETVVLTADTSSCKPVLDAIASSVYAAGAIPMVITCATPRGVGKAADPDLPIESMVGALMGADVWIELNKQWLLYSTVFERVEADHRQLRYMNLVEFNEDMLIRTVGQVNTRELRSFMYRVAEKTRNTKLMHIKNAAGTDVCFEIEPSHVVSCDCGDATEPGFHMLSGQINVVPRFGTIQGTIVFDGCLTPPFGRILTEPVHLSIENSRIICIDGGADARHFEKWLHSFDDEGMLKMAHVAYGFNPGAKLTGNIVEDERVWGCTEWGIGYVSPYDAPPNGQQAKSHCDGICIDSSVWLDGHQIMDEGVIVDEELRALSPIKLT